MHSSPQIMPQILIVDNDLEIRTLLARRLICCGYQLVFPVKKHMRPA